LRRHTVIAHGRHAVRERRLDAARQRQHGLHILTFEQLAARLAGGLTCSVDEETLRQAVQAALPTLNLGELDSLKSLPGMVAAAVDTISKVWSAGIDLQQRAASHPRLSSIATLERAVLVALPPNMMRPADLVAAALARLEYAPTLIGPMEVVGLTELALCWRPLLLGLATRVSVRWIAGPRSVPAWLEGCGIQIERAEGQAPQIMTVSASTAYQEAIDAVRFSPRAKPNQRRLRLQPSPLLSTTITSSLCGTMPTLSFISCMACTSPPAGTGRRPPRSRTFYCVVSLRYVSGGSRRCYVPIRARFRIFPRAGYVSCRATRRSRRVRHGPACWSG